ncbi:MAG: phosphoribosylanthranilate isomerase [Pseudomonadota bacterium]
MTRVKICGLTNREDALAAAAFGADALGAVFAPGPRRVEPGQAREIFADLPPLVLKVGVFVNEQIETIREIKACCGLDAIQLSGDEGEDYVEALGGRVFKAFKMRPDFPAPPVASFARAAWLLDAYAPGRAGGTGLAFDWRLAVGPARQRPIILAGGLNPDNVREAVKTVRPYAVDVSSGVESKPGRKDHDKIERFIRLAKSGD